MPRSVKFTYAEAFDVNRFYREIMIILHNDGFSIYKNTITVDRDKENINLEIILHD